ncbi:Fic/DOC family N-terminal domain-containing protein [Nguyenibacter vanlangensis]|uniref:Fic/DOC family N-terminal domain-containing protein n=1 Tax=Nguyenibacter vanlangensis TaxID=1216886 RepID=A0ABZ3D8W0_9PROT
MVELMRNPRLGCFVGTPVAGEIVRAFVPPPLPPEPSIDVLGLLERLSLAEHALGRLDGIIMLLPRQELFLYMYVRNMYVRKEAVLSSQIEGTQSTGFWNILICRSVRNYAFRRPKRFLGSGNSASRSISV